MQLTLKDIARMVGVAESTVSRAINNKPGVGEDTKQKILSIAKQFNYRPNQLARGLANKQTNMIALFIAEMKSPSAIEIISSIEKAANQAGYQVILCNINHDLAKEKAYLELLDTNQVDGAIFAGGQLADEHLIKASLSGENKIILLNRLTEELLLPSVITDNSRGTYLATEHLITQGAQRIALLTDENESLIKEEKVSGYQKALEEHAIAYNQNLVIDSQGSREAGYHAFLELINLSDPPDAFLATNDLLTVGLVEAIKMGGYFIPLDFLLVGYGDNLLTSIFDPSLTVVKEPYQELGQKAVDFLTDSLAGKKLAEMIVVLDPVLKIRKSSIKN